MKKPIVFLAGALAVFGGVDAMAATNWGTQAGSVADLSSAPATRERQNVNYEKYQTRTTTRTYEQKDAGDLYYSQPANRSALYKQYNNGGATKTTVRTTRAERVVDTMKRKYYLAHPFFQPVQGKFGSITDLSYNMGGYDFTINQTVPVVGAISGTPDILWNGLGGKWESNAFSVKEDFSYGITERIAILGMLQYDAAEYEFTWDDDSPDDKMDDNGINLFGLGAQWRFVDTPEWIATLSAYYQHQKDVSNNFVLDLKAGYKVHTSTIYGLVRGWYLDLEGNSYGNYVTGTNAFGGESSMYIPYQVGDTSATYIEGGLGVFSVLNEDWTLNVEALYGDYDWHNQASIKGAIGWQPEDWFALNLYVKTAFYDSADGKTLDFWWREPAAQLEDGSFITDFTKLGTVELDKYSETSVGLQVIFQF